jgi:hypothetical protein
VPGAKSPEQEQQEQENVRDIALTLQQLVEREEVTVKYILDRLYSIGTANILHHHIQVRSLHPVLRSIFWGSRPIARRVGMWWFQKNGATLITRWLHSLVVFEPEPDPPLQTIDIAAAQELDALRELNALPPATALTYRREMNLYRLEMAQLRSRVRMLAGCLVGAIALFGSSFFWLDYRLKPAASEFIQEQNLSDIRPITAPVSP